MTRFPAAASFFVCAFLGAVAVRGAEPERLSFNRDVRPILSENCFACHGFDARKRQADLRLDLAESAFAPRDGGVAIKPGDPAKSLVMARVLSQDANAVMPPPASHKKLTEAQKSTLRRWIAEGATYQKHWAFEPPTKGPEPAVRQADRVRNPIDRFVLARLERDGLAPQPEADRETLVRRVAFALTGLPPTVAEVDAFLADDSPHAYAKMVDRYLASPRYGEEMARHWLDLARYADTHGLHLDNERHMFAYRDWVIDAFNRNLSFDRFTVEQLAGDLLPNPTPEQLAATGFNRCNVTTSEGGAIGEEFLYRYAVDRAGTTMETWMGLTGGCAVCHDHKYDPITSKDFYSFFAFFYSAADPAMDGNMTSTPPFQKVPRDGQQAALEAATAREAAALRRLEAHAQAPAYVDPGDIGVGAEESTSDKDTAADAQRALRAAARPDSAAVSDVVFDDFFPLGSTVRNTARNPSDWVVDPEGGAPSGRRALRTANARFHEEAVQLPLAPLVVPQRGRIEVWLRLDPHRPSTAVAISVGTTAGTRRVWWGEESALDDGIAGLTSAERRGPLPKPGAWNRLVVATDDIGLKSGQRIEAITLQEAGGVAWWDAPVVSGDVDPATDPRASFAAWRLALATKSPPDIPGDLAKVLTAGPEKTRNESPQTIARLRTFYLTHVARPLDTEHEKLRREWEAARTERFAADRAIVGTMIFRELDKPRNAFVMVRGQYDKPGEKVSPDVPTVFPPLRKSDPAARATRLDMARWLVSAEHPLTARVQVNRLWQQFFGTGLTKTSSDFGSQGEIPSHPELLDWLAVHYRESGWDTKALVRLIVGSAVFRQRSAVPADVRARDPENRLIARGARFRLDAEPIRDNALFVGGLIDLRMGGRGTKGYQPPGIWEPVGYGDSNTRYYLQDHGSDLYRRSIYAFLKRTAPPPFMSNFDGPNREQACARRERSNTPLQALQLLNDVQHFEAARALAERTLAEGGRSDDDRIAFLYRTVLSRRPRDEELRLVRTAHEAQRTLYRADPQAAAAAIRVGESVPRRIADDVETAAWTLTANLILNLDETVTRP